MTESGREGVVNFAAGPAAIATEVLVEAQKGVLNYGGLGIGVMEISHRSPYYDQLNSETIDLVRSILNVPENYAILFLQGGGTGQFAAVPLNLTTGKDNVVDYFVTGTWSNKAAKEAGKYATVHYTLPQTDSYVSIPPSNEWSLSPNATYVYYCDNETVHGIEFPSVPEVGGRTLVCDMSSNFLTRPIDFTKFGLVYAGIQKNAGCAGLCVVIVNKDLLGRPRDECPIFMDYTVQTKAKSMYNTPNVWGVYIFNLVLKWVYKQGGIKAMARLCTTKSRLLLNAIQASQGFYCNPVLNRVQSRVNIPIRICNGSGPSTELEAKFVEEAEKAKIFQVKGHRSVGGLRASLYNAVSVGDTKVFIDFMTKFMAENHLEP